MRPRVLHCLCGALVDARYAGLHLLDVHHVRTRAPRSRLWTTVDFIRKVTGAA